MAPVEITKKVGLKADNDEGDVKKIQTLLNLAGIEPFLTVNGLCDQNTIAAIGNFQEIWGKLDYKCKIDPGSKTLQYLNDTVKPLVLNEMKLIHIGSGGYEISYSGFVPPKKYKVMLYLNGKHSFLHIPDDAIDITPTIKKNKSFNVRLKVDSTLPKLLAMIEKQKTWGWSIPCRIYLVNEHGVVISVSNEANLKCPVQPYDGPIKLDMAQTDMYMNYSWSGPGYHHDGRYFWPEPIDGKFFFAYGSPCIFETESKMRGFDCSTYVSTILNLKVAKGEMGSGAGEIIADKIGATRCIFEYAPGKTKEMEDIDSAMLKYFFTNNSKGYFIVWSPGHVMLVVNGIVHEFTIPPGPPGYYKRSVNERPWMKGKIFHIRRIPQERVNNSFLR